jgi:hypothetical protein
LLNQVKAKISTIFNLNSCQGFSSSQPKLGNLCFSTPIPKNRFGWGCCFFGSATRILDLTHYICTPYEVSSKSLFHHQCF